MIDSLGVGGAERLLVSLLPNISSDRVCIDVISLFTDISLSQELEQKGVNVLSLGSSYRWNIFSITFKLFRVIKSKKYDIIWGHLYFGNLYSALVKYFFSNLHVIWTLHSPRNAMSTPEHQFKFKLRGFIEKFLGKHKVDKIVAVSNSVALDYKNSMGWKNINVIYNGVVISDFPKKAILKKKREIREKYNICSNDFLIVTPGRYSPQKGHSVMASALNFLINKNNNKKLKWIAVGSGGYKHFLEGLIISYNLKDKVVLLDSMPHLDVLNLVQSANLVVLPSIRESFGISAVEAMCLGVPLIVSDVDGLTEVVVDGAGIRVNPNDSEGLSKAISTLMKNEGKRQDISRFAKIYACKKFNIKLSTIEWVKVFYNIESL